MAVDRNKYPDYIEVTWGGSGYFAVHRRYYEDIKGYDNEQTGVGRYRTFAEAEAEARDWAETHEMPYGPPPVSAGQ